MLATFDIVNWLADRLSMQPQLVEQTLWGLLLIGLVFASIHLITMLVTKWGEKSLTRKSLVFSVIVHLSCGFGLATVDPQLPQVFLGEEEEVVTIQPVFVEGDEDITLEEKGNTPFWDKLPETDSDKLARIDRSPLDFEPLAGPKRRPDEAIHPDLDVPDVPTLPEATPARPEVLRTGVDGFRQEAVAPLNVNDPTADAQPEVEIPTPSIQRRKIDRGGLQTSTISRTPRRGAIERLQPDFQPDQQLASIDGAKSANSIFRPDATDTTMKKRAGPTPAEIPIEDAGTIDGEMGAPGAAAGTVGRSRFTRLKSRTLNTRDNGALDRIKPTRTPSTPRPVPGDSVAVRDGIRSALPTPGLRPSVVRPNIDPILTQRNTRIPATYRLRSLAKRLETALKYGGTDASERAVEASLKWLALNQEAEGYWDADSHGAGKVKIDEEGVDRKNAGINADAGLTGLSILSFLGAGYTHEEGQYSQQINRALRWLIEQQDDDGFLGGNATRYARMYCHAIATYAMAEAYGMQSDPTTDTGIREPLAKAIAYIVDHQNPSGGGWRYIKGQRGDMSMFGWQLMALKSAEIAGIPVPQQTKDLMIKFLNDRGLGKEKGLAAYRWTDPPTPPSKSMTAEALFCKQVMGIPRTHPACLEAVEYLMERIPRRSEQNLYYWYYGTLAMYQHGGGDWRRWNESLRDSLIADQITDGDEAGSWAPRVPWGPYGGRVYSTALSTLCLEVYYRFLPLYQAGGQYSVEE
ncbi:MAG: hypothetical protein CMJ78_03785 [Planctomycetaceae bacterium]|nr:hypothetical protein [Planctomycetaceae bacterium]